MFRIVNITPEESTCILHTDIETYEEADLLFDVYAYRYPHGIIEIEEFVDNQWELT